MIVDRSPKTRRIFSARAKNVGHEVFDELLLFIIYGQPIGVIGGWQKSLQVGIDGANALWGEGLRTEGFVGIDAQLVLGIIGSQGVHPHAVEWFVTAQFIVAQVTIHSIVDWRLLRM